MDYITVDALRVSASHGHYEHERKTEQEFLVTLKVGYESRPAGSSDKLVDTIDYDELRCVVHKIFKGAQRYLVERLAEDIAGEILKDERAKEVRVSIQKTAVWSDGIPGVEITRKQA